MVLLQVKGTQEVLDSVPIRWGEGGSRKKLSVLVFVFEFVLTS